MKKSAGLYLSAREASAELAISQATLYAYVSRGLIRSEPSQDSRSHRYRAEDVRTLKERRTPSPEPRGLRSFDADLPVMDSAVATITEDGPIYRGVNCVDLAERDTLEHAATLLWDVTGADPFEQDNCPVVSDEMRAVADATRGANAIDRAIAVLALAASADPRAFTRAPEGRAMLGGRIIRLVVATMLNAKSSAKPLHLQIARVWAPDNKHAADLIRRALVLLADHELNASTFTVRCAASTGLNLYDSIIAGLVALKGPKHGGAGVLAAQLLKTLANGEVAPVIRERVALGERFAGFGHGVYKHGDPRARALLEALARSGADRKLTHEIPDSIAEATGEFVNIDYALAVLVHTLGLPPGHELVLFSMARTVGWIAHACEQLRHGRLIRPRARYVGPAPGRQPRSGPDGGAASRRRARRSPPRTRPASTDVCRCAGGAAGRHIHAMPRPRARLAAHAPSPGEHRGNIDAEEKHAAASRARPPSPARRRGSAAQSARKTRPAFPSAGRTLRSAPSRPDIATSARRREFRVASDGRPRTPSRRRARRRRSPPPARPTASVRHPAPARSGQG